MTDGPDVPGEWDPSGQAEPPAALLRRAISHVEQLLQRLERPGAAVEDGEVASGAPAEGGGPIGMTVEGSLPRDDSGAIEPVLANPVRRISSAAQAEALRVSLNAHEKANRLLAEASAIRAQSASEGEQILVEARELADRLQSEATEEAALYVQRAREEAENLVTQAGTELQRVRDAATDEADRIRADAATEAQTSLQAADAEATGLRESARQDAEQARREAQEESEQLRTSARDESEQLRTSARDESDRVQADAEHLRNSVQQEADRLLTASGEEAQRLRDDAEREAERVRSDAENQARVDREAADAAIREALDEATADADRIRIQAREQGQAEAAQIIDARVSEAVAQAQGELDAEKVRVYELLGSANDSVAEVRSSMRELIEALGHSMGAVNGATGSIDALMTRLRDAAQEHGVRIAGPPTDPTDSSVHVSRADDTGPLEAVRDESPGTDAGDEDPDERETAFDHDAIYRENAEGAESENADEDEEGGGSEDARRPLGLLFGASHKSRASKR